MQDGQSAAEEVTVFNPLRVDEGGRTQAQQSIPLSNIVVRVYFWDTDSDADLITADKIAKIKAVEDAIYALPNGHRVSLNGRMHKTTPAALAHM